MPRTAERTLAGSGVPVVAMTATSTCPHSASGTPVSTTSATPGTVARVASTPAGAIFTPPVISTSSTRPSTRQRPSTSRPRSSVWNRRVPAGSRSNAGSPGRPRYPRATTGPARLIRPDSWVRTVTPASGDPS